MSEGASFIDGLLEEAEERESKLELQHIDLILSEIGKLESKIEQNWNVTASEIDLLKEWSLKKNSAYTDRIQFLEKKLNNFILESDKKTIELPNGTIRLRKGREKYIVEDFDKILKYSFADQLTKAKQSIQADLNKIRIFCKRSGFVPEGIKLIKSKESEFSYKLNKSGGNNGSTKT